MFRRTFLALSATMAAAAWALPAVAKPFESTRIQVSVVGEGPDVILIPGLSSSPKVWADMVRALPGHRYHLVQLNGFAGAPVSGAAEGLVVAPAAEELARYIIEAGLTKPALIGHSLGGSITLMIAARHSDVVGKVMVVDMMPFLGAMFGPPGATPESVRPIADQVEQGMEKSPADQYSVRLEPTITGMVRTESRRAMPLADARASDRGVSGRAMHELIVTDLRPELSRIIAPVTVLYVRPASAPITDAQMDAYYRQSFAGVRGAKLTRIPDSDHFIMLDQPTRFVEEVRLFLGD